MIFFELSKILILEEQAIRFLFNKLAFSNSPICLCFNNNMFLKLSRNSFRHPLKKCRKEVSIFRKTFFENIKINCNTILYIFYYYICNMPMTDIIATSGVFLNVLSTGLLIKYIFLLILLNMKAW